MIENAVEPEKNPETDKKLIEMQTFLLAYLTAKVSPAVYLTCWNPAFCKNLSSVFWQTNILRESLNG